MATAPTAQDGEGWPAAKLFAALAECEIAECRTRRIQRHLAEARLPGGKTLATFDFKVLPDLRKWGCSVVDGGTPRPRMEPPHRSALSASRGAGDWIDSGSNLIAIGNSGAGKTHVLCAIGSMRGRGDPAAPRRTLIEAGFRVLYTRTPAETVGDLVQKLQAARRDLTLEAAPPVSQAGPNSTSSTS